jgi:pimeloyl-ACP methyl ester carboxylesterase
MKRVLSITAGVLLVTLSLVGASVWEPDRPVSSLTARWALPPSQFVEVEGLRVHLRDVGPREDPVPLVLLHGTSASLHTWEGWVTALEGTHRVMTLDLPGFGLTGPFPDGDARIVRTLELLRTLLAKLGVQRCVLGGNSYGGRLAWEFALRHPEHVEKLVLVDASGYPRDATSVPIGFRIAATPGLRKLAEVMLPRALIEKSLRNVYGDPSKVTPELVDRYFELTLREGNRGALARRMEQPFEGEVEKLKSLSMPALIMWGGEDRLIPPENGRRFARDLPHARLVMFETLGHVPQEEDPVRTAAEVEAFLAE